MLMLVLICSAASAVPNLNTQSGYVLQPDAQVIGSGRLDLAAGYVASEGTNGLTQLGLGTVACHGRGLNVRGVYGIGHRIEVGFGLEDVRKHLGHSVATNLAAKVRIIDRPELGEGVSAGLSFRNWSTAMDLNLSNGGRIRLDIPIVVSAYMVMDKVWRPSGMSGGSVTASLGAVYDHYGPSKQKPAPFASSPGIPINADGEVDERDFVVPFLGVKVECPRGWAFLGDFRLREGSGSFKYQGTTWSLAARKTLSSKLVGTAGVTTFNLPYVDPNPGWFVDLSYALK